MNRNSTIDLFRLLASFFIIAIHTYLPDFGNEIGSIIRLSGRWAVPFFFITAGYYLGRKIESSSILNFSNIENNVIKLISIFIVSSTIYLIHSIFCSGDWVSNNVAFLFIGTYWHLWFIGSLIFGYIVIWYIYKIHYQRYLPIVSLTILFIGIMSSSYDVFIGKEINYDEIPAFLISIPFMFIGILLSKKEIDKNRLPFWISIFLIGFILQFFEVFLLYRFLGFSTYCHRLLLGTVVSTVALFIICLTLNMKNNYLSQLGEKYSLFIYLYHILGYWVLRKTFEIVNLSDTDLLNILRPIFCFIVTLGAAIILDRYMPRVFSILNGNIPKLSRS